MPQEMPHDYDVVIVGLGPIGALLANLVGAKGWRVLAVERDTAVYPLPRAVHIDHECLRLLSLAGADKAVLDVSRPNPSYQFTTAHGELLMGFRPPADPAPTGYPWSSMFYQPALEHALRDRMTGIANIETRLGCAFEGYEEDVSGITVKLDDGETVRTRYLVGCDGGRSAVRRAAGIGLDDLDFNEPWVVVDVLLPERWDVLEETARQFCDPVRPTTSIPIGGGRHRWEFMLLDGESADGMTTRERLDPLIAPRLPEGMTPADIEIERAAVYTFHGVFAKEWTKGRVMLIGDAAHQMPPFMGQGLCSGIRDAANLAWKLDAVLAGHAAEALLGTVQAEREPQVRFITETAIGMGRVVCTQNAEEAAKRDADMCTAPVDARWNSIGDLPPITCGIGEGEAAGHPFVRDVVVDARSVLAPVLVLSPDADRAGAEAWTQAIPGLAIASATGALADQLAEAPALLARPDRVVFGTGEPYALVSAYAAYLSGRRRAAA